MMKQLNVVVIGTGMYVCGRGTDGYGTIMPALLEWKRDNDIGKMYIVGNSLKGISLLKSKIKELQQKMGIKIPIEYFPEDKDNPEAYIQAVKKIPKPAVAIVVVPDDLHTKVAGAAVENGLHTFVVKPLAPTVKEVEELIKLQTKNKVYCAVEFHKRLDLANLKLKDVIGHRAIGDPLYFLIEYSQRKSVPTQIFKKWVKDTNVFQYLGIHYVDIIYFATGAMPKRVMATGQKSWLVSKGIDNYDAIEAIIEWQMPSGKRFSSHILTNWIDPEATSAMSDQKIRVIGTNGRFESDQKKRGITVVTDEKGIEELNPYFCSAYGSAGSTSYRGYGIDSVQQFLRDVQQIEDGTLTPNDLEQTRPSFKQSLVPTRVLEAVNESLQKNGAWVEIGKK